MFDAFEAEFKPTDRAPHPGEPAPSGGNPELEQLFASWQGVTFRHGLYRIHTAGSAATAKAIAHEMFTGIDDDHYFFAVDWFGRQYAWCTDEDNSVAIYEPHYGEAFDTELSVAEFHNRALIEQPGIPVEPDGFERWRAASGVTDLPFDQCVGLTVPLFLGGEDEIANYSVSGIEVYWSMTAQLRMAVGD